MHKQTKKIFSAVQASGDLHLGNYLGALKQWQELSREYNCIFCAVDMHALTVNPTAEQLIESTRNAIAAFIACGIDTDKNIIFNQSRVPQHSELAWIFNCVARIGWLNRMTQFKDKAGKNREQVSLGLYVYPSLMAADILLYKANLIPVGEDQKQHIELTRDIAQKFNNDYKERYQSLGYGNDYYFELPAPLIPQKASRVMSLRDGTKKMSKSDPSELSRINLRDTADEIANKIRKAKTDPDALPDNIEALASRPEADNLITIYSSLANITKTNAVELFAGKQFSDLKKNLIDLTIDKIEPISKKLKLLQQDQGYINNILDKGEERAKEIAEKNMKEIRKIVGFI